MPFTVIKGHFAPDLGRPDGDSVRFVPDSAGPIFTLEQRDRGPKINPVNGSIQLRYEGMDTMESAALRPFSSDATASNLELLGPGRPRGYICSTQLGPNGRPIALVFLGETDVEHGGEVFLEPDDIEASVNMAQIVRGHAYPLFYDTLFADLRDRMAERAVAARAAGIGVWAADASANVEWTGDVASLPPIFPKLWRRIQKYVGDDTFFDPARPMAGLKDWLRAGRNERVLLLSEGRFTGFDNVVEVTDTRVCLTAKPEDMVVVSR